MTLSDFNDIRPYNSEEIPQIIDELATDEAFRESMRKTFTVPVDAMLAKGRQCGSLLEIQKTFVYPFLKGILDQKSDGIDMQADELDRNGSYTFISNHRDIVLDAALLSEMMVDIGFNRTAELCTGDNLLTVPWIEKIVRLNKGIVVKRGLSLREQLVSSKHLSDYIHYVINVKKDNVWIAQRQGRAKDSNDLTQESILKMLSMGGKGTLKESIKELNIVPLTISYEFDPCDFLKAREYQMRRDNPDFKKTRDEDVNSMETGMFGYKGHIHYQAGNTINEWVDSLPDQMPKTEFFASLTHHVDHIIHSNYRLYANNYIASDMLREEERFAQLYTPQEKKRFEDYLHTQLGRIEMENPDNTFLIHKMLEMYANPLYNYLKAADQNH